jgi:hypothetical protein
MTGITDYDQHKVGWNQTTEQTPTLYRNTAISQKFNIQKLYFTDFVKTTIIKQLLPRSTYH